MKVYSNEAQTLRDLLLISMAETIELLLMATTRAEISSGRHSTATSHMAMKAGELRAVTEGFREVVK